MKITEVPAPAATKPEACHAPCALSSEKESSPKPDRITFGMDISPSAGCCVAKIKTGRTGGCCAHISHEKFVEGYKTALQREFETTGVKPVLDAELEAILNGEATPEVLAPVETQEPRRKPSLKQIALWPFRESARLFKWLFIGLWKDLKQVMTRKPVA